MTPADLLNTPLLIAGVFVFGLLIGSFLNVVILRVPAKLEYEWRCQCEELLDIEPNAPDQAPPPGIVFPPSACPHCGHRLRAWENIPVLSFLVLRGRCSGCSNKIGIRYPLVEILTGAAFALVVWQLGPGIAGLAGLVLTSFLIALAGIDFDQQLLPDDLCLPLLWLGLLLSLAGVFTTTRDAVIGAAAGYLLLWGVFHVFRLLTGKIGMGHGDFKLMAALGAWFGWQSLPLIVVMASGTGAVLGLALLALDRTRAGRPVPFGPFIALAGFVYLLAGEQITATYLAFSGLG